jgi:3-hydroxybutyryl-CoA dehydrogenase
VGLSGSAELGYVGLMQAGQVKRLGVVGAGQMGRGIAQVAAAAGLAVDLCDAKRELADGARATVAGTLKKLVEKGKMPAADADALVGRIRVVASPSELGEVDMAVEAVTEQLEVKLAVLREADAALRPGAILASNTSSISISKLAAATSRPELVVGMHFMNPVPLMKLCEIVRGVQTSNDTFETTIKLAERLGKTVIRSNDAPGFLVNRMLIPFLNEACFTLQEGVGTAEDIDKGAKLGLNHPMGPLELADLIGLDTCLFIAEVLHRELGDSKYRPATVLRNLVAAGWLGKKTRRGFYRYDEAGQKIG